MAPKILAFAGSLRVDSHNKKLVRIAAQGARAAGASITELDLREIPMPLYDGDIEREQGLPPNAKLFKRMLIEHQGILVATPEYNASITAVLKNAIDWASRAEPGEPPYLAYRGKVAGLLSASPGYYGGVRSLAVVRALLAHLGALVVPGQLSVPRANEAFDAQGNLKDAAQRDLALAVGEDVTNLLRKLA